MKTILVALLLLWAVAANAAPSFPRVDIRELAVDVSTTSTIDISSTTYTAVADSTVFASTVNIWAIEVYVPVGMTKTINCGFGIGVSTTSSNNAFGREVLPASGVLWQTDYNKNTLYCESQGQESAGVKTRATITLFR